MYKNRLWIVGSILIALVLLVTSATQASSSFVTLWLVTDNDSHTKLAIHPIDPVTLQDIPNSSPISMGHHYVAALNADRTLMAAIIWPSAYDTNGVLHLIDLRNWKDQTTTVKLNDYASEFNFGADGNSLSWLAPTKKDSVHETPRDYAVFTCSIVSCADPTKIVTLPSDFMIQDAQWINSSSQLAIFGIPTDPDFLANAAPQLIFVDTTQQKITTTLTLDGLDAGQHPAKNAKNIMHYEYNQPGLAWDIKVGLLYIAHPTQTIITVVDLSGQTIKQHVRLSASKALGHAKGMQSGTQRIALLNPNGSQLYISSHVQTVTIEDNGLFKMDAKPAGIRVIDTREMKQTQHADLPLFEMTLSPDGRTLIATGTTREQPSAGAGSVTLSGLYILDAATLEVRHHIEVKNDWLALHGFSADSRYAYVGLDNIGPSEIPPSLNVIDLATGEIVHKRSIPAGYSQLFGGLNPLSW